MTTITVLLAACSATPKPKGAPAQAEPRAALVILDGFGIAPPGPTNAIATALNARPNGFLARALVDDAMPVTLLGAAGECVGLPPGLVGNSEAGHNAICAGQPVIQRRTLIDRMVADGSIAAAAPLRAAMTRAQRGNRPIHVIAYLSDVSSNGSYEHVMPVLRMAARLEVSDVQLHLICDGRSTLECAAAMARIDPVIEETGRGTYATVVGRRVCIERAGPTAATRRCIDGMRRTHTSEPEDIESVRQRLRATPALGDTLEPVPIRGGKPITDGDVVILLTYRRDVSVGMVRLLRHRAGPSAANAGAPTTAAPRGPLLVTFGILDARPRYADDPDLVEAFAVEEPSGLFYSRLHTAGFPQVRIAEEKKAPHVSYFCDQRSVTPDALYQRYHPASLARDAYVTHPCLSSAASTQHAVDVMAHGAARFVLINLPNADMLGHTEDFDAAVAAIGCLDHLLARLAAAARISGYDLLVTADHGNAEAMSRPDGVYVGHTANPVPLIVSSGRGLRLRHPKPRACIGAVAWTVLDVLGLADGDPRSLLERP